MSLRCLPFLILLVSLSTEAAITVTDKKGRTMDVDVLHYTKSSGNVKIKRTDGQVFAVKISIFDSDSQKKIEEAAPKARAKLLIDVSVGKRRARLGDSSYMKKQTITASVDIQNQSRDVDFPQGKGTVFLVARQTKRYADDNSDYGKVLSKESFSPAMLAGETVKFEAKPVVTTYDSDRDSSNIGGWEYYGYIFVLEDSDGDIFSVETSIALLDKEVKAKPDIAKQILQLAEGSIVEKNMEKR